MVVLTIVAKNNGETVYFEEPIPRVHFIRLLSCSLYNSWHNLKNEGSLSWGPKMLQLRMFLKFFQCITL